MIQQRLLLRRNFLTPLIVGFLLSRCSRIHPMKTCSMPFTRWVPSEVEGCGWYQKRETTSCLVDLMSLHYSLFIRKNRWQRCNRQENFGYSMEYIHWWASRLWHKSLWWFSYLRLKRCPKARSHWINFCKILVPLHQRSTLSSKGQSWQRH